MNKLILTIMLIVPFLLFGINLEESLELGLKNNKEIQIAEKEVDEAKLDWKISKSKLYPKITFTSGLQFKRDDLPKSELPSKINFSSFIDNNATHNDSILASLMSGISNSMIPEKVSTTTGFMGNLAVNQVLYAGNKIINSITISKKLLEIKQNNLHLKKTEIKNKITNSYNTILLLQKVLDINQEAVKLANEHLMQVQAMNENGLVSEYDLLRAKLEKSKFKPQLIEAKNNLKLAMLSFRNLIGISSVLKIDGEMKIKIVDIKGEEYYVKEGLKNRLELRNAKLFTQILDKQVKIALGNFLPNFILKADWQLYSGIDDMKFQSSDFGSTGTIQVGFQYNLFSGKSDLQNIMKSKISFRKSQVTITNIKNMITIQIKNNYQNLKKELAKLKLNEQNLELAKKGFSIASARYQNKVGIQLEVFDAQLQLKMAKLKYFQSKYNLIKAENDLLVSIGK